MIARRKRLIKRRVVITQRNMVEIIMNLELINMLEVLGEQLQFIIKIEKREI